jgi:hypothetical protein
VQTCAGQRCYSSAASGAAMRVAAIILAGFTVAQAEPNTLTLACTGTITEEDAQSQNKQTKPISMGIIVNFATGAVQGFDFFEPKSLMDYPVKITGATDVKVEFQGSKDLFGSQTLSTRGTIDRVTGDVEATSMSLNAKTNKIIGQVDWALKCKPTQRMF